jgi:hypothetical protein
MAYRHGNIKVSAQGINDIRKQKSFPLSFGQATKLKSNERVKLSILVDLAVNPNQQPRSFERRKVLANIFEIRHQKLPLF